MIFIAPAKAAGYFNLGILYKLQQDHQRAAAAFEEAVGRDPLHLEAFVNLVEMLIAQNKYDEAVLRSDERIEQFAGKPRMLAPVYDLKGRLMLLQNRPFLAEHLFKQSILQDENHLPAYYSLAELYIKGGRARQAIEKFQKAAETNPDKVMLPMMLGILHYMRQDDDAVPWTSTRILQPLPITWPTCWRKRKKT
jgi:tetratricopeptide (TPR) repeat protein